MTDAKVWSERPCAPPPGTVVCAFADVADGAARAFRFGRGWQAFELLVVRAGEVAYGYVNECAHNPLPLNIDERIFTAGDKVHCDHHYAVFRFADGLCVDGVCKGERLIAVPLERSGDDVRIATANG